MEIEIKRWSQDSLTKGLKIWRSVYLAGARQCGKTTLAKQLKLSNGHFLSLDDARVRQLVHDNPESLLRTPGQTVIIDEVQKEPELFSVLKLAMDSNKSKGQYLLTGSSSISALPQFHESLAGRMGTIRLHTMAAAEIKGGKPDFLDRLFKDDFAPSIQGYGRTAIIELALRGGYPETLDMPMEYRNLFLKKYLDSILIHDVRELMDIRALDILAKLSEALFARSSKYVATNELTSALGIKYETYQRFLGILKALFLFMEVPSYRDNDFAGAMKRSKIYACDSGLMAAMLNYEPEDLEKDQDRVGKLVETFVWHELAVQADLGMDYALSQYRDSAGHEIDLIVRNRKGALAGIEIKAGSHVGKEDFKHLKWFQEKLPKNVCFKGVVLYTGSDTLHFSKDLVALPMGFLCE